MSYSSKNLLESKLRGKISSRLCVNDVTKVNAYAKMAKCKQAQKPKGIINIDGESKRLPQLECIESFI